MTVHVPARFFVRISLLNNFIVHDNPDRMNYTTTLESSWLWRKWHSKSGHHDQKKSAKNKVGPRLHDLSYSETHFSPKVIHSRRYQTNERLPWWITQNQCFQSWWCMINKWPPWKITQETPIDIDGGGSEGFQFFVWSRKNRHPDVPTLVTESTRSGNQTTFYLWWEPFNTYRTTKISFLRQLLICFFHVMLFLISSTIDRSWVGGVHES